ncbi:aldo/keto reductase [Xylariales sp. PMI_506]|nr:aldo/keto reductase [Xylariales sp. PMI_506]
MSVKSSPPFIYGTAWKREDTAVIVAEAIRHGFTAFDTALQLVHYREELLGVAIREAFANKTFTNRADIFIQTKFSRSTGKDQSLVAYPLGVPLEEQVDASIKASLYNLRHDDDHPQSSYIDSLLLHSPFPDFADTLRAWKVFETYVQSGRVRALGISNLSFEVLTELYSSVEIKPAFVQVRFHPETAYQIPMRRFCAEKGIVFEAHRILKGDNKTLLLESDVVKEVVAALGLKSEAAALYLCVLGLSDCVRIVNGTKTPEHMDEDLEAVKKFQEWVQTSDNQKSWGSFMGRFKSLIGEE